MLAEHVDHVIGIDPDRDRITAAIVAADTAAVIDTTELTTTADGYRQLVTWADHHSSAESRAWSIEGAGSYGAGATQWLTRCGEWVLEFDRPSTTTAKDRAKTDTLDAVRAAREALGRTRLAQPRRGAERQGLRALTVARDGAQRARVAAINELRSVIVTGPIELRDQLTGLTRGALIDRCARLRACGEHAALKAALASIARRIRNLDAEIADLDIQIRPIVEHQAPQLLNEVGISHTTAARLLIAWSHPGRFPTEAAFARLAGVAPIQASSGQHTRHRLSRGGDRQLNRAIHSIVITRCRVDPATRNYLARRIADGKTPREARRCLKRYTARRIWRLLEHPPTRA
jgi:hypothetical protein